MQYFHNFTTGQVNEDEIEFCAEWLDNGDKVYYTRSGDAILKPIEDDDFLMAALRQIIELWKTD